MDPHNDNLCGGWTEERPANPEVQALCDPLITDFVKKTGIDVKTFKAVTYKTQVVAGINYSVKVCLGGDQYWRLLIFKPLPYTGEKPRLINAIQENSKADAIQH